jgi:transposase
MGRPASVAVSAPVMNEWERPMSQPFDASTSLTVLDQDSMLIVVIEVSQSSWLVSALVPGVERQPLKKLEPDEGALLKLLHRWRGEATRAGRISTASSLPMKQDAMAFGSRVGCGNEMSKLMSFIRQASPYHANIGAPRLIGSIPKC